MVIPNVSLAVDIGKGLQSFEQIKPDHGWPSSLGFTP
jgi:hypothetical protein